LQWGRRQAGMRGSKNSVFELSDSAQGRQLHCLVAWVTHVTGLTEDVRCWTQNEVLQCFWGNDLLHM
jgi:hypothetical protein